MEERINGMKAKTVETYQEWIYIAGDIEQAKQVCREYCMEVGLCVTVEPMTYVYTGGEEAGMRVGLMNYPRFESDYVVVGDHAFNLAQKLRERLCQWSFSLVDREKTTWYSARPENGVQAD